VEKHPLKIHLQGKPFQSASAGQTISICASKVNHFNQRQQGKPFQSAPAGQTISICASRANHFNLRQEGAESMAISL